MPGSVLTFCEPTPSPAARAKTPNEDPIAMGMDALEEALREAEEEVEVTTSALDEALYYLEEANAPMDGEGDADAEELTAHEASVEEVDEVRARERRWDEDDAREEAERRERARTAFAIDRFDMITACKAAVRKAKAADSAARDALEVAKAALMAAQANEEPAAIAAHFEEPAAVAAHFEEPAVAAHFEEPAAVAAHFEEPAAKARPEVVNITSATDADKDAKAAVLLAMERLGAAQAKKASAHKATKHMRHALNDAIKDAAFKRTYLATHMGHNLDQEYFRICIEEVVPSTQAALEEAKRAEVEANAAVPIAEAALKAAQDVEVATKAALITARNVTKKEKKVEAYAAVAAEVSSGRGVPAWLARCYEMTADRGDAIGSTALLDAYMADTNIEMSVQAFGREMIAAHGEGPDKKKRLTKGFAYLGLRRRANVGQA